MRYVMVSGALALSFTACGEVTPMDKLKDEAVEARKLLMSNDTAVCGNSFGHGVRFEQSFAYTAV